MECFKSFSLMEFARLLVHISLLLQSLSVVILLQEDCPTTDVNFNSVRGQLFEDMIQNFTSENELNNTAVDSSCTIFNSLDTFLKASGEVTILEASEAVRSFECSFGIIPACDLATLETVYDLLIEDATNSGSAARLLLQGEVAVQDATELSSPKDLTEEAIEDLLVRKSAANDCVVFDVAGELFFEPQAEVLQIFDQLQGLQSFFTSSYCQQKTLVDTLIIVLFIVEGVRFLLVTRLSIRHSSLADPILQVAETVSSTVRIAIIVNLDDIIIVTVTFVLLIIDLIISFIYAYMITRGIEIEETTLEPKPVPDSV